MNRLDRSFLVADIITAVKKATAPFAAEIDACIDEVLKATAGDSSGDVLVAGLLALRPISDAGVAAHLHNAGAPFVAVGRPD